MQSIASGKAVSMVVLIDQLRIAMWKGVSRG